MFGWPKHRGFVAETMTSIQLKKERHSEIAEAIQPAANIMHNVVATPRGTTKTKDLSTRVADRRR